MVHFLCHAQRFLLCSRSSGALSNFAIESSNERAMIERYTRPEMAQIWSEERKVSTWLQVELLACAAWAREGVIPAAALDTINSAVLDLDRMHAIEIEAHHDVISFLRMLQEQVGPDGRYIHLGLTSSDVLDTALAIQVRDAGSEITAQL